MLASRHGWRKGTVPGERRAEPEALIAELMAKETLDSEEAQRTVKTSS